jgi:hypothetical protein
MRKLLAPRRLARWLRDSHQTDRRARPRQLPQQQLLKPVTDCSWIVSQPAHRGIGRPMIDYALSTMWRRRGRWSVSGRFWIVSRLRSG